MWITDDRAKRVIDIALKVLDDIAEIDIAEARVGMVGHHPDPDTQMLLPSLVLEYSIKAHPEILALGMRPAQAIVLTSLATGEYHNDDKLRRLIRDKVEAYLTAIGYPVRALKIDI